MKKVLVLSASPRRGGNSDTLCDQFIRGAKEAGNDVEKVFLRDKKIGYCSGCGFCNQTHQCVQKDDMQEMIEKMLQADVIVLSTPIYFYTINGQMKTFIDRTVPRYHDIKNKEFYYIITAEEKEIDKMQPAIEDFRAFTKGCLTGTVEKGIIYGVGAWEKGAINKLPVMQEAYEMGKHVDA